MPEASYPVCPIPGCDRRHPPAELLCRRHWRQVPQSLRDDVWRLYRAWLRETPHTIATALQLREAQQQAIASVTKEATGA